MYKHFVDFIRTLYDTPAGYIPLHEPRFIGNEKKYVLDCIDSTFVSSTGAYVDKVSSDLCKITGAKFAIPVVNGTAALHLSLVVAGVKQNDEVITQALTFIATANAISYIGAIPHFVDVDKDTMGMSPSLLRNYLTGIAELKNGHCYNKLTGRRIAACVPMHTFGLPLRIEELAKVCADFNLVLIEDAAESLGSTVHGKHTGLSGLMGTLSFNGNKIVTSGGGGAIITNNADLGAKLKHLSTQAKVPHAFEYNHDAIGYNYRMPNINAALACAQLEQLPFFLEDKRAVATAYHEYLADSTDLVCVKEREGTVSNYWLNAVVLKDKNHRDEFLNFMTAHEIMVRPIWNLMNHLEMYKSMPAANLDNSEFLAERVVNITSSARAKK